MPRRRLLALPALVALLALALVACSGSGIGGDAAGQLVANQTSSSCDAPPFPSGTVTPAGANPLPGITTVTAQAVPKDHGGTPGSAVKREVIAAARNYVNCWNERKFEAVITLTTADFLKSFLVLANPQDAIIVLNGLPDVRYDVLSLGDARNEPGGRVSVAVEYNIIHQQKVSRWYFLKRDGRWLLDQEERLSFDLGVQKSTIDIQAADFSYAVSPARVPASQAVVLKITNNGKLPHEVVVVRADANVNPTALLQPGVKPDGVEFVGQAMAVAGGGKAEIVLTGLKPDRYILICQLRFPGGEVHSAQGMLSLFTVE